MDTKLSRAALEEDDLAWAKPYFEEARAAVARGEVISLEEAIADIDACIASLCSTGSPGKAEGTG